MAIRRFSGSNLSGSKSSKIWDQTTTPGYYESIATVVITSTGTSSFSFTNIPQNYTHLQIRWSGKEESNGTSNWYGLSCVFNSDTNANYSNHYLGTYAVTGGGGQTTFSASDTANGYMNIGIMSRGNGDNVTFGSGIVDILEYTSATKFKTMRSFSGFIYATTPNRMDLMGGCWRSQNPVTRLDISNAGNFAVGTTFALYGVKGV